MVEHELFHVHINFEQENNFEGWIFLCLFLFEHAYEVNKVLSISVSANDMIENRWNIYMMEENPRLLRVVSASKHIRERNYKSVMVINLSSGLKI